MDLEKKFALLATCEGKYHEMDPMSEELLPDGTHLRDGMQVIIERSASREDLDTIHDSASKLENALRYNRWCTVSDIEHRNSETSFIGEYEDGTKRKILAHTISAWYVKIGSVPIPFLKENEQIFRWVYSALLEGGDNPIDAQKRASKVADRITDLIKEM